MTKSFLYSFLIHLVLGIVVFILWMQSAPKYKEEKISISLQSAYQPIQPTCACDALPPSAPKPIPTKPIVPKPTVATVQKPSVPIQSPQPTPPIVQTPSPKPLIAPVPIQSLPPQSVKVSTPPSPPPPPANPEKEYLKLNLAEIRALLIQNQQYPKQAKRLRMQGDVELHFQLNSNGSVEDLKIVQGSGFELLDEDAKALILKTAPQFPKPSKSVQLKLPISYILH